MTKRADELREWLLGYGREHPDPASLALDMAGRLAGAGVPLWRLTLFIPEQHPVLIGRTFEWRADTGIAREIEVQRGVRMTRFFSHSPIALAFRIAAPVRRRLTGPDAELDFELMEEFAALGVTDYLVMPMFFEGDRTAAFASFATRVEAGFDGPSVRLLTGLAGPLGAALEIYSLRRSLSDLLETYLGREPAQQIRAGQVVLGSGRTRRAVVFVADMRGFTALSERLPRDEVLGILNDWYACLVGSIEAEGGDVLKFIGDGLLAIWPYRSPDDGRDAARRALRAAEQAWLKLCALNERRLGSGQELIAGGMGLHAGDVAYGNIGAADRLDFTVVGPAVNRASRLEGLCRELGEPILLSAEFAALLDRPLRDLGYHRLRGIAEPRQVFAPLRPEEG